MVGKVCRQKKNILIDYLLFAWWCGELNSHLIVHVCYDCNYI